MVEGTDLRGDLLARIAAKRAGLQAHLRKHRPRTRRLANATILLTSLSALLTVGPGTGDDRFRGTVAALDGLDKWQALCIAACVVSVAAAVLTQLSKSQDARTRLTTAEAVDTELEGLAFLLEFGQLPVEEAIKLYQQYTAKLGYLEDVAPGGGGPASAAPAPEPLDGPPGRVPVAADRPRVARGLPVVPPPARHAASRQSPRDRRPPPPH
jgi:hypothetical protein